MGYSDREGFITITDRIKDMMKVKGIAVAPAELEDLLLGRPMVEDVAVGTISNDYTGQHPKAHVVLKPSILHGKDRLTIFSLLHQIVSLVRGCDIPVSRRSTCFKRPPRVTVGRYSDACCVNWDQGIMGRGVIW